MNSNQIIGWMIVACILFAVFLVFSKPLKNFAKFCINGVIGISALFIGNYFLLPLGFSVGINWFTALFSGVLGIPGVICLYVMRIISSGNIV